MRTCGVAGCSNDHLAKGLCNKHYRRKRRADARQRPAHRPASWEQSQLDDAEAFLDDGTSYREASRSTGVPYTTLREKLPGRGWTAQQGGQLGLFIAGNPEILALEREIGLLKNEI